MFVACHSPPKTQKLIGLVITPTVEDSYRRAAKIELILLLGMVRSKDD